MGRVENDATVSLFELLVCEIILGSVQLAQARRIIGTSLNSLQYLNAIKYLYCSIWELGRV